MTMKMVEMRNYAGTLRDALILRRNGTLDMESDRLLGHIAYNIVKWALIELVRKGSLDTVHSNDRDFLAQCVLMVVTYYDRVNLDMDPPGLVVYLKKVAQSAARAQLNAETCPMRKHENVDLESVTLTTDFYGRRTYDTALDF